MVRRWTRTALLAVLVLLLALPAHAESPAPPATTTAPPPTTTDPTTPAATATATAVTAFKDVPTSHWAHDVVDRLLAAGIIARSPSQLFRPEEPVLRSEFFKMLLVARRLPVTGECEAMFRDVACSAWYAPAAETAYRMGIAEGVGVDLFGPDMPVTRQQLFTIIMRGTGRRWEAASQTWTQVSERLKRFADAGRIAEWARPPVALAASLGLVAGYGDATFRPEALASRAEAAALVSRIILGGQGLQTLTIDGRTVTFVKAHDMMATMYASGEPGVGSITYTGMRVRAGAIAVDPSVIPLGKLLYVEGYGYGIAADIGGAIKGNRVDLFTHDYREAALRFGIQPRKVWVLP